MNRYRVQMVAELQAESEAEAIEFLEDTYGDFDPEPIRVLTLEVGCGEVIDTPEWVAKRVVDVSAAPPSTFTISVGNGVSDPVPYDASQEVAQAAYEQARSRNHEASR